MAETIEDRCTHQSIRGEAISTVLSGGKLPRLSRRDSGTPLDPWHATC